jgi:hypothetical protein
MSELKTQLNDANVRDFLNSVEDDTRRKDGLGLLKLYSDVTGEPAKMWGTSIVGFGQYHYKSERSSQEGDWPLTSFSPRKQNLTLYFMDGFDSHADQLSKLGKHKISKGCLYINKLADVDQAVLKELVSQSYQAMKKANS